MTQKQLKPLTVPEETDYIGIYLTNRCFLSCDYCLTEISAAFRNNKVCKELDPGDWIEGLNRLGLPPEIPLTFQGGEPFLYEGIWDLLNCVHHKIDILTALPPNVTVERFKKLKTLQWNERTAPYPLIRVSFHYQQNDYRQLILRIKELEAECGLSIGLFHIDHPGYPELVKEIREFAKQQGVEFRTKAFLGEFNGKVYGEYKYPDACLGRVMHECVLCRNTVYPIAPDGTIYRCHSDLYALRKEVALGNVMDRDLELTHKHRACAVYGLCSPCDIKVKTNHLQQFGYTSVDIKFSEQP